MKFQKKILSNGITILHENRDVPVVSFSISNPFAASHENSEIKGVAHLIEHLVFTGTKTRTNEEISKEIEKRGGVLNAFTSHDVTSFWFKLPSEHLFTGADIIVDILKNSVFEKEKFEKEKKVVMEEIKMRHDNPQIDIFRKLEENLYEKPFGEGIIGSEKTISALKRDFVFDYFKKNYSPENYIIAVVGKSDFSKVCSYIEKQFQAHKKILAPVPVKKKTSESTEEREGIDQAHFAIGFHAPSADNKKHQVLEVLDAYLASGMSSKLYLEIREKRGLAYAVLSSINTEKYYSYYSIYVGTKKESIPEVKSLILEGFKKISEMTEENLSDSKERLIGLREISSEESLNVMNNLIFTHLSTDNADDYYKYKEKINVVTLREVKDLAKEITGSYSTAAIVPK